MSDANAKSSIKRTSFKKEVEKIKLVMGPFCAVLNDKEYMLKMDPEYARSYSVEMMELAIPVGTYTKVVDKNGKITARVNDKTGKPFRPARTISKTIAKNEKEEVR